MKPIFRSLLIILALFSPLYGQEHTPRPPSTPAPMPKATPASSPDGWVTFNSVPGRFSVLMPEIPNDKTETVQSDHGPYTTHLFVVREKSIFLIGWVDYDTNFNFNKSSELEANRDNFIKGVKATLINSRSLTLDGYQAIEFTAETAETIFKSRVYMVGRRPYQLVAGTSKGVDDSRNVGLFFESFKVRPQ
jgi:hypothetical protein